MTDHESVAPVDPTSTQRKAWARTRTFKPRRRALRPKRAADLERLTPVWCLDVDGGPFVAATVFGRSAPLILDIGIGKGESLIEMAAVDPGVDHIGFDVHTPGIAAAIGHIDERELSNVRLVHGDALTFIDRLGDGVVAGIRLYFPDPWLKSKQRHRRMTNETNVARFVEILEPGGFLHVATDIADYALSTQRICGAHPELDGGVIDRPTWRPQTRYEVKGLAAGRPPTDLLYTRSG